jgi:hypothetical protein
VIADEADGLLRACIIVAYDTTGELALQDDNKKIFCSLACACRYMCTYAYMVGGRTSTSREALVF